MGTFLQAISYWKLSPKTLSFRDAEHQLLPTHMATQNRHVK